MGYEGRTYFLANVCHVCKSKKTLYVCEICRMIFYCSPEHRRENWFDHSEICWAINKICESEHCDCLWELYDAKDFKKFRHEVANKCAVLLNRNLKSWEFELIYYPRACSVCWKFNWKSLSCCKDCEFTYTCEQGHFREDHKKWCKTLKTYADLTIYQSIKNKTGVAPFELEIKTAEFHKSMADFLERNSEHKNSEISKALKSEVLTYPLTVLHGLRRLGCLQKRELTILFVGAEVQAEVEPSDKWEKYLLHFLNEVEYLNLKFLGPELQETGREFFEDLCKACSQKVNTSTTELENLSELLYMQSNCRLLPPCNVLICNLWAFFHRGTHNVGVQRGFDPLKQILSTPLYSLNGRHEEKQKKTLKLQCIGCKFYHEHSYHGSEQPHMICAFNSGMYRDFGYKNENSWKETIQKLFRRGSPPVLITEYTCRELDLVLERIRSLCGNVDVIVQPEMNPFASFKPGLNIISDSEIPVIFKNYFYALLQKK